MSKKTIIDSVQNYTEAKQIILAIVKAVAEKWPEHCQYMTDSAGNHGIKLGNFATTPPRANGGKTRGGPRWHVLATIYVKSVTTLSKMHRGKITKIINVKNVNQKKVNFYYGQKNQKN